MLQQDCCKPIEKIVGFDRLAKTSRMWGRSYSTRTLPLQPGKCPDTSPVLDVSLAAGCSSKCSKIIYGFCPPSNSNKKPSVDSLPTPLLLCPSAPLLLCPSAPLLLCPSAPSPD